ncbi:MAG: hypothetical protein DRR06_18165 [Gammaproteobacteria bacterium]|nr:MAG: hypothetical protein DRR06_18165 [Gammaproteobacteria bacterium]
MASSPLEICNSALVKVGAARIGSLSDPTKSARICNEQYNKMRKKLLRIHPWNFSKRSISLGASGNTPIFSDIYTNEFSIPSNVLRILKTDLATTTSWALENSPTTNKQVILADAVTIKIQCLIDMTDTTVFTPDFDEVLALLLAQDFAYSIVQSISLARELKLEYKYELGQARSFSSQERGSLQEVESDTWIDIRN